MKYLAWHFIHSNMCAGEGQEPPWTEGETRQVEGDPKLCNWGYHGSRRIIDVLPYAPGPVICRVEIGGKISLGHDKIAGQTRTLLWALPVDVSERILHEFACYVAEAILDTLPPDKVDPRSREAIAVKRRWLDGKATAEELSAAWYAAKSAAKSAVESDSDYLLESLVIQAAVDLGKKPII